MAFEVFEKQRAPRIGGPSVTIQKRGAISINGPAYSLLGSPKHVELLYDRAERLIGIRKADSTVRHAYLVRPLSKSGSTHVISGTAFLAWYEIPIEEARRWPAKLRKGTLVVDLKEPGVDATGNRARDGASSG